MEDNDSIWGSVAALVVVLIICIALLVADKEHDGRVWNNGYCTCGGEWRYVMPVSRAYNTYYLYNCDKCGKTHEFTKKR